MYYGWRIVGVAFVTLFMSVGFGFYSFGPFFKALADDFGGSRTGVSIGVSIFSISSGLIAPALGRRIDRGSIRQLMSLGTLVLSAGFLLLAATRSLWQFYIVLALLVSVGAAMIGGVTASALVAQWFVARRGMALGIATMGISLSGVVMAPTATWLIHSIGWRGSFVVYSVLTVAVVLPAVLWLVVDRPEDLGLEPDGRTVLRRLGTATATRDARQGGRDMAAAARAARPAPAPLRLLSRGSFWLIALVISLNMSANGAILTHIIPHATDLGIGAAPAAWILSLIAGFGVLGKVLFGWIADRLDKRVALLLIIALQSTAVFALLFVSDLDHLLLSGAVFGLGMGGLVPLWGALIGSFYGRRSFGRVMGAMSPVMLPLQASGVPLAGLIYDRQASYQQAFIVFLGLYAVAAVFSCFLRAPDEEPGEESGGESTGSAVA